MENKDTKEPKDPSEPKENKILTLKRKHVLGKLYEKCENIENIPVYLEDSAEESIGFADESMGRYVDAFVFHLPDTICRKLSSNGYEVLVDWVASKTNSGKITINRFTLGTPRSAVIAPVSKRASAETAAAK